MKTLFIIFLQFFVVLNLFCFEQCPTPMDTTPTQIIGIKRGFEEDFEEKETHTAKSLRILPNKKEYLFQNRVTIERHIKMIENVLAHHSLERHHRNLLETQLEMGQFLLKGLFIKEPTK